MLELGTREIYVRYDDGMADSKLKIPAAKNRHEQEHEYGCEAGDALRCRSGSLRAVCRDAAGYGSLITIGIRVVGTDEEFAAAGLLRTARIASSAVPGARAMR